jgi:hypothetical protein
MKEKNENNSSQIDTKQKDGGKVEEVSENGMELESENPIAKNDADKTTPKEKEISPKSESNKASTTVEESFSPLQEPRIDRDYATGDLQDQQPHAENIPEPSFTPNADQPIIEEFDDKGNLTSKKPKANKGDIDDSELYNPQMNDVSKKEQKQAAEMAAEALIDTYLEYKPKLFKYIGKVPKKKIEKMIRDGKLDMSIKMQFEDGIFSCKQKVDEINNMVDESFKSSPDFKDKILPPLTRIFLKRGIAMTDEQYVLFETAKDMVGSVAELVQIKSMTNQLLVYASDTKMQVELNLKIKEEEWRIKYEAEHGNINNRQGTTGQPGNNPERPNPQDQQNNHSRHDNFAPQNNQDAQNPNVDFTKEKETIISPAGKDDKKGQNDEGEITDFEIVNPVIYPTTPKENAPDSSDVKEMKITKPAENEKGIEDTVDEGDARII